MILFLGSSLGPFLLPFFNYVFTENVLFYYSAAQSACDVHYKIVLKRLVNLIAVFLSANIDYVSQEYLLISYL